MNLCSIPYITMHLWTLLLLLLLWYSPSLPISFIHDSLLLFTPFETENNVCVCVCNRSFMYIAVAVQWPSNVLLFLQRFFSAMDDTRERERERERIHVRRFLPFLLSSSAFLIFLRSQKIKSQISKIFD